MKTSNSSPVTSASICMKPGEWGMGHHSTMYGNRRMGHGTSQYNVWEQGYDLLDMSHEVFLILRVRNEENVSHTHQRGRHILDGFLTHSLVFSAHLIERPRPLTTPSATPTRTCEKMPSMAATVFFCSTVASPVFTRDKSTTSSAVYTHYYTSVKILKMK